jgi:hypothetical protein
MSLQQFDFEIIIDFVVTKYILLIALKFFQ